VSDDRKIAKQQKQIWVMIAMSIINSISPTIMTQI